MDYVLPWNGQTTAICSKVFPISLSKHEERVLFFTRMNTTYTLIQHIRKIYVFSK